MRACAIKVQNLLVPVKEGDDCSILLHFTTWHLLVNQHGFIRNINTVLWLKPSLKNSHIHKIVTWFQILTCCKKLRRLARYAFVWGYKQKLHYVNTKTTQFWSQPCWAHCLTHRPELHSWHHSRKKRKIHMCLNEKQNILVSCKACLFCRPYFSHIWTSAILIQRGNQCYVTTSLLKPPQVQHLALALNSFGMMAHMLIYCAMDFEHATKFYAGVHLQGTLSPLIDWGPPFVIPRFLGKNAG